MSELSDRVLWQQAREGRAPAFGVLFERHAGRIYNYCFRRTGDWALAEDLTSTTFLLAWRSHGRAPLQAESALPLLYGIATNVLRNQRRSLRRRRDAFARLPLERAEEPDFAEEGPTRLDDQAEMRQLLQLSPAPASGAGRGRALRLERALVRRRGSRPRHPDRHGPLAAGARPSPAAGTRTANGPEGDIDVVPLRIEVNKQ